MTRSINLPKVWGDFDLGVKILTLILFDLMAGGDGPRAAQAAAGADAQAESEWRLKR